jgi:hypothetical protein
MTRVQSCVLLALRVDGKAVDSPSTVSSIVKELAPGKTAVNTGAGGHVGVAVPLIRLISETLDLCASPVSAQRPVICEIEGAAAELEIRLSKTFCRPACFENLLEWKQVTNDT